MRQIVAILLGGPKASQGDLGVAEYWRKLRHYSRADNLARRKVVWEALQVAQFAPPDQYADHLARRKVIWEALQVGQFVPPAQYANLARRKVIWEMLSTQIAPKLTGGRPAGFASETAAASGINKSTISRDLARAAALGPDLPAIGGNRPASHGETARRAQDGGGAGQCGEGAETGSTILWCLLCAC